MRRKIIINNDNEHSIDIYDYFINIEDNPKYFCYSFLEDANWKKNYHACLYFLGKDIGTIQIIGYENEIVEEFIITKGKLMSIKDQLISETQKTFMVKIESININKT